MAYVHIPVIALQSGTYGPYAPCVSFVGKNLKHIREERQQTQDQIAEDCGVPQNQWSKWESGKSQPKLKTLLNLSVALDLPLQRLVHGVNKDFDLACQKRDQQSGLPLGKGLAYDPATARVERQHLAALEETTGEVLKLSDRLHHLATDLEEIRKAAKGETSRSSRHRKTG